MFIGQKAGNHNQSGHCDLAQSEADHQCNQQHEHGNMQHSGQSESARNAKGLGNGVEAVNAVKVYVLAGVKNVKTANPESDGGCKNQNAKIERTTNAYPGSRGRNTKSKAQDQV